MVVFPGKRGRRLLGVAIATTCVLHVERLGGVPSLTSAGSMAWDVSAKSRELQDIPSTARIPRTLHYIWPDRNFTFDAEHSFEQAEVHARVSNIRSLNPGWTVKVWTDDDCHDLVKRHFPKFYPVWIGLRPKLKMWDAVRPAILSVHGGVYLDHDIGCENVHFDDWITPKTTLLIREPHVKKKIVGNHFMGSTRGHRIWDIYMENIVNMRQEGKLRVTLHTGPGQLYRSYLRFTNESATATAEPSSFLSSTRCLGLDELSNGDECERDTRSGRLGLNCSRPRCIHAMGISPAEIDGEDDNAGYQIKVSRNRNKKWRLGQGGGQGQQHTKLASVGVVNEGDVAGYTKAKCDPCKRLQMYLRAGREAVTDGPPPRPAVFVHIPKTGGTTLENLMNISKGNKGSCHATAAAFEKCDPRAYGASLSFAALRHPLDRAISLYKYAREGGNRSKKDRMKFRWASRLNFASFINAISERQKLRRDYFYAPQMHYIAAAAAAAAVNVTSENFASGDEEMKRPPVLMVDKLICAEALTGGWEKLKRLAPHLGAFGDFPVKRYRVAKRHIDQEVTVDASTELKLREIYGDDYRLWEEHCASYGRAASSKKPTLFVHFHKAGGTSVCKTMRSRIPMTDQNGNHRSKLRNCNTENSGPRSDVSLRSLQTCRVLEAYTTDRIGVPFKRENFLAVEVPFEEPMPCPGFRSFSVMRLPAERLISHMHHHKLNSSVVTLWIDNKTRNQEDNYMTGYPVVNCFTIRLLLGRERYSDIRPIDADDLERAKQQVDKFDAFVPLEYLHHKNVLRHLSQTVPEYYEGLINNDFVARRGGKKYDYEKKK